MKKSASLMIVGLVLSACSGSAASDEELRAAELIHGAKDKVVMQSTGTIAQKTASPAAFTLTTPAATGDILTISKLEKCKYQSIVDVSMMGGSIYRLTVDLTGLLPEGLEKAQEGARGLRLLKGAKVTCELAKQGTPNPDAATATPANICEIIEKPGAVPMVAETAGLDALATQFKTDFCQ